jgi:NFU1 iron-sulfur cluster scaffold homolog, mitochondrial
MFIQTEATPNPDTFKFLPGRDVLGSGTREFETIEDAAISPLARALFAIDGVRRVYLAGDFLSITKWPDFDWSFLKPMALAAIMDHYMTGLPVLEADAAEPGTETETVYEGEAAEIVEQIKDLIETRVRPAVAQDGGDIIFNAFEIETGKVTLTLRGACSGCPSSTLTLKQGIENMLRHYVPEVRTVVAAA